MTKLDEKLQERQTVRASLLEHRKELEGLVKEAKLMANRAEALQLAVHREERRLVELSTEAASLLHADASGIVNALPEVEAPASVPSASAA